MFYQLDRAGVASRATFALLLTLVLGVLFAIDIPTNEEFESRSLRSVLRRFSDISVDPPVTDDILQRATTVVVASFETLKSEVMWSGLDDYGAPRGSNVAFPDHPDPSSFPVSNFLIRVEDVIRSSDGVESGALLRLRTGGWSEHGTSNGWLRVPEVGTRRLLLLHTDLDGVFTLLNWGSIVIEGEIARYDDLGDSPVVFLPNTSSTEFIEALRGAVSP